MLGRLEMDIDDCIMAYSELMGSIFGKSRLPVNWKLQTRSKFDSAKLESAVKGIISKYCTSESNDFNDHVERGCRV